MVLVPPPAHGGATAQASPGSTQVVLGRALRVDRRGGGYGQPDGEGRAAAGLAFDLDLAAHQAGQPAADREPEAGAAVAALAGRAGLTELLEQLAHLVGLD